MKYLIFLLLLSCSESGKPLNSEWKLESFEIHLRPIEPMVFALIMPGEQKCGIVSFQGFENKGIFKHTHCMNWYLPPGKYFLHHDRLELKHQSGYSSFWR